MLAELVNVKSVCLTDGCCSNVSLQVALIKHEAFLQQVSGREPLQITPRPRCQRDFPQNLLWAQTGTSE